MAIIATFNQGMKIATEINLAVAASGDPAGRMWFQGGRWFNAITDGLPTLQDTQATIFPVGHAGDRRINQQNPVVGRKWAEGNFSAPVVADFILPLLYAAFGNASTNMTPGATASLLANLPLTINPQSLVLTGQPSNSGAVLRFELKGSTSPGGTISICGIDAYGLGASELISLGNNANAQYYYSRNSYSAIAASGVAISGIDTGSVTIFGVQYWTHTFTTASSAPSLTVERIGNPTAGESSANQAFINPGLVLQELTLNLDAEANDGIIMADATFQGYPTALSTATSLQAPSPMKIWPSWATRVRRDNGTVWDVVTNFGLTINTGNRVYNAAAGVQNPQGVFFGPQEFTGNVAILLNNELEFQKWRGASQIRFHALISSHWKLTSAQNMEISASIPGFFEDMSVDEGDSDFRFAGNYRVVRDDNYPMSIAVINGVPGRALHSSLAL